MDEEPELYIQMQFLSGLAGYLKTQIPFLTWITLGKSDKFDVLVVSRPWQSALFCCYAVLMQNAFRPAADPLQQLQLFRFKIQTLHSSCGIM